MFLWIANLILSIAYITLYGSFVDEWAVFSENALFVSFCIFLCIFSISSFLYQKKMWILFSLFYSTHCLLNLCFLLWYSHILRKGFSCILMNRTINHYWRRYRFSYLCLYENKSEDLSFFLYQKYFSYFDRGFIRECLFHEREWKF